MAEKKDETIVSDNGVDKGETVSRDAHERLLGQRKADQARAKAAEEERDRLLAEKQEREDASLAEQKKFQDLYEKEKKKREESETKLSEMTKTQITREKQSALSAALGNIKKEYLGFAKLDEIAMTEDGTPDPETVKTVANKFREQYPELIPGKVKEKLPNEAARGGSNGKTDRKLTDLSHAELVQLRRQKAAEAGKK